MSAVLRGRGGLTFEQALGHLATVATRELPTHLPSVGGAHVIFIPTFIRGVGPRLYGIDNVVDPRTGEHWYGYRQFEQTAERGSASARLGLAGTGGIYLASKDRRWQRALFRLLNAHDRGKVSDDVIAHQLATLNYEAHQGVRDGTVGPRCIVVWRRRPDAESVATGGAHQFYTGTEPDEHSRAIPTISNGMDVRAMAGIDVDAFRTQPADDGAGPTVDKEAVNRLLAQMHTPDERLR